MASSRRLLLLSVYLGLGPHYSQNSTQYRALVVPSMDACWSDSSISRVLVWCECGEIGESHPQSQSRPPQQLLDQADARESSGLASSYVFLVLEGQDSEYPLCQYYGSGDQYVRQAQWCGNRTFRSRDYWGVLAYSMPLVSSSVVDLPLDIPSLCVSVLVLTARASASWNFILGEDHTHVYFLTR